MSKFLRFTKAGTPDHLVAIDAEAVTSVAETLQPGQTEVWSGSQYLLVRESFAVVSQAIEEARAGQDAVAENPVGLAPIGSFSRALMRLKEGAKVCRRGWNGKGVWLALISAPTQYFQLDALPWIGMKTARDEFVPWLASQADLLAEDWEEMAEAKAASACRHTHFTIARDGQTVCVDCGAPVFPEAGRP